MTGVIVNAAVLGVSLQARADGDPATDAVPRVIAYNGTLEFDGEAFNGPVEMQFDVYDGADSPAAVWTEQYFGESRAVSVYNGAFEVQLGRYATNLASIIAGADDLYLTVSIRNPDGTLVALSGRQRFTPAPYSMWAARGSDFTVERDLFVDRNADVTGTTRLRGAVTADSTIAATGDVSTGGALRSTGNASVGGALTVGSTSTLTGALTVNNTATVSGQLNVGNASTPGVVNLTGAGPSASIEFPNDMGGGSGDDAWIRYLREGASGENMQLQIGISNDIDDEIAFWQQGAARMTIADADVRISDDLNVTGALGVSGALTIAGASRMNGALTFDTRSESGWNSAGNGVVWGDLYSYTCPANQYVCGIQVRDEPNQGGIDDTGVNELWVKCCSFGG